MEIDINKLSEKELIELNNKIIARLRFLNEMRNHSQMLEFNIGERVSFHPAGGREIFGIITRYNKKTVTIVTEDGQRWNVSPVFLKKVKSKEQSKHNGKSAKVIEFRQP